MKMEAQSQGFNDKQGAPPTAAAASHWDREGQAFPMGLQKEHGPADPLTWDSWPQSCGRTGTLLLLWRPPLVVSCQSSPGPGAHRRRTQRDRRLPRPRLPGTALTPSGLQPCVQPTWTCSPQLSFRSSMMTASRALP